MQLNTWRSYSPEVLALIDIILVDDYSDRSLVPDISGLPIRLLRVETDIDWNMAGCRNLAATQAKTDWLLFHDIDHVMDGENISRLLAGLSSLDAETLYRFSRIENGVLIDSHVNSFLVKRAMFWDLNGYDEDFCGFYGFEDIYLLECWMRKGNKILLLNNVEFRVEGSSTPRLSRDVSRNRALMEQKLASADSVGGESIRFKWAEL